MPGGRIDGILQFGAAPGENAETPLPHRKYHRGQNYYKNLFTELIFRGN